MVYNKYMKETYFKDEKGQWWCQGKRQKERATEQTCEQCGRVFPNRHKQMFCSNDCRSASQRGKVRRPNRICGWCGKEFTPKVRRKNICCSKRCAYDLGNSKRGRPGESNPNWKGGIKKGPADYLREYVQGRGHLLQHRLVMERALGRQLLRGEIVHHKNGDKKDNRLKNLELCLKNHHPPSQRVSDLLIYAHWIIDNYGKLENK